MRGVDPEIKRYKEIKAGVITACVGIGLLLFLAIFMEGVAHANPEEAVILERVWVAGVIPLMIGLGLIINGVFITKRMNKVPGVGVFTTLAPSPGLPPHQTTTNPLEQRTWPGILGEPQSSSQPSPPDFSVAEPATQQCQIPARSEPSDVSC